MSKRTILILGVLVLLGLVSGLFTGPIEKALGIPQAMQQAQGNPKINMPAANPPGAMPADNNQPNQPTNILATDTFQRQNQPSWGIASDGRQWGGDINKPSFSITNLKGQIAGGQGALEAIIGLPADNVEVTISGSINQFGNNVNLGIVLRWTSPNNWYKAFIDGNQLVILKSVNGQNSRIAQVDMKTNAGVAYTLRFRSLGTVLSAKVWPSATAEPQKWLVIDDHTFPTGQFGVRVLEQPTTVITITSFSATTAAIGNKI